MRWSFFDVMFSADIQKLRRELMLQIGIRLAQPPRTTPNGQSRAKELVGGTKFHLVLFSGPAASDMHQQAGRELAGFTDLVECHEVPLTRDTTALYRASGVSQPAFYLIRPDQYIAYRGQRLDGGLRRYLQTFLN